MTFNFDSGIGAVLDDRLSQHFAGGHCFIALTPAVDGQAVFINFSSVRDHSADTHREFVLQAGEHPFISRPTCVPMNYARLYPVAKLTAWVNDNLPDVVTFERMDHSLHIRMIEAVLESDYTREEIKKFITMNFGDKAYLRARNCVVSPSTDATSSTGDTA
ncbi:hypothetical protein OJ996_22340 [Luteolibacter sp. GHJ8]|uniref:Uncharacterized protein n=1 Tax=Luteolibacter rhizosphaerae TaxID=2989719 RepID=A0ABT3G935_9BACT|nr:hypothetical protein [Luteolibacter rhizosphaerae]MCW1916345.1 hypothetical protein [Luteolibacter rhizosphaerae]